MLTYQADYFFIYECLMNLLVQKKQTKNEKQLFFRSYYIC